jgi:hypothetical protein
VIPALTERVVTMTAPKQAKPAAPAKTDARTPTNFGALVAEEDDAALHRNEIDKYPSLLTALQNSRAQGKGALIPPRGAAMLPNEDAKKLVRLLRQGATKLGIGLSVGLAVDVDTDGHWKRVDDTHAGPARVRFAAKDKKQFVADKPRKPTLSKPKKDATPAQHAAKQEKYDAAYDEYVRKVKAWNASHDADSQITPTAK